MDSCHFGIHSSKRVLGVEVIHKMMSNDDDDHDFMSHAGYRILFSISASCYNCRCDYSLSAFVCVFYIGQGYRHCLVASKLCREVSRLRTLLLKNLEKVRRRKVGFYF